MTNIEFDNRLGELFKEYLAEGKDDEFIRMLRTYLNMLLENERAAEKAEKKAQIQNAQVIKDAMTTEEKIKFVNTPYEQLPEELKPGMTKNPQMFNFIRMSHPHIGEQKETFAARLIKYKDKYNLTDKNFAAICNEFAAKHDLKATKTRKAQKTRITERDLVSYENFNICPKIDKMTVIAEAMGVSLDYFGGYGTDNRRSKNEILEAKYRKRRNKKEAVV